MPRINVRAAFRLNHGGVITFYASGIHEVEEDVAAHWYVKLFADRLDDTEPSEASPARADSAPVPDERDALRAMAEERGIKVDGRWSADRIRKAIESQGEG